MSSVYTGNLTVSIFGQSHAPAIGVTIDGLPAGFPINLDELQFFLSRRAPGQNAWSTPRREVDAPEVLCGLKNGKTCGAPLTAIIRNTNTRSGDYENLKDVPRPGHADYTAQVKFGGAQDASGGGHFSGRLTAPMCIAGGICMQLLEHEGVRIRARILSIGTVTDSAPFDAPVAGKPFPAVSDGAATTMQEEIAQAKADGDSVGGVIECVIDGLPAGIGEPMFGGLENLIARTVFAIPAVKGVDFGAGFAAARLRGSENNDPFRVQNGHIVTETNNCGGILGGISTGMPVVFRAAFKPTPSISRTQASVSLSRMENETLVIHGRHDPCIVPRAVPCVEAAAAIAVLDAWLSAFLQSGCFDGLNVTIPYKKDIIPYCAELSETARAIGAVNTIVRRTDGTLWGDNTDAYGFSMLVQSSGAEIRGRKALIFGSGGASATAQYVLRQMGAREVVVISRHGTNSYENLDRHADTEIAVNTTPVGMYPNTGVSPVDLSRFPKLEAALDVVYNPARTKFLLEAERLGLKRANGLLMLVAQAKKSCEDFLGEPIADERIGAITKALTAQMQNVILIGMPGSGKTTIGTRLAAQLGRTFLDADTVLEQKAGIPIPEIFRLEGEEGFRQRETAVLTELGKHSGLVIATGGGCVTKSENYPLLHQNGTIFCLTRELDRLPLDGRPVSQALGAEEIYRRRKPLYEKFADAMINNDRTVEDAVHQILEVLG